MTASSAKPAPSAHRLARSTSPYLRQHADNPVDWYPWGPEALARAQAEDKPILLSVGYSSCHWCHVMAHESFEDPDVAAVMNEKFVNIKVDREERPDIDAIYQRVVQLMGEGGGWPLTVFLTPDQRPFYGGTYFPPEPRYGRPGFVQLLAAIDDAYRNRKDDVAKQVQQFREGLQAIEGIVDQQAEQASGEPEPWDSSALRVAVKRLLSRVDPEWGGFGKQPKFPNPTALELLLRLAREQGDAEPVAREAAAALRNTLDKMYRGGIYDHLRGGFARYSVDPVWLVPHFEKMLYDNALLLPIYAEAAALWPEADWLRRVTEETIEYLRADMRTPEGTFWAATDADSEGEEGKYFCWTPAEVAAVLDDDELTKIVRIVYGVGDEGNFEHGWSILNLPRTLDERAQDLGLSRAELDARLARAKAELLEHRYGRVPPHRDEKVLTSWVALLVSGLARAAAAGQAWPVPAPVAEWTALAETAAERLLQAHVDAEGHVLRAEFEGEVHTRGVLDDVAFLARACLDLHTLTLYPKWREHARALAEHAVQSYARPGKDGFYFTAVDAEALIERPESQHDGPIPSGLAVMIEVLARLEAADDAPPTARAIVEKTLRRYHGAMSEPFAYASLLTAASHVAENARHVKVRGPDLHDPAVQAIAAAVREHALHDRFALTLSFHPADTIDAIVCRGQVCSAPLHHRAAVLDALRPDAQR